MNWGDTVKGKASTLIFSFCKKMKSRDTAYEIKIFVYHFRTQRKQELLECVFLGRAGLRLRRLGLRQVTYIFL